MKRKIITQKQLDKLVSLGIVNKSIFGYAYDGCLLLYGIMAEELIGKTIDVEKNDIPGEGFPFKTKKWRIPAFIFKCNYKKMLAKEIKKCNYKKMLAKEIKK